MFLYMHIYIKALVHVTAGNCAIDNYNSSETTKFVELLWISNFMDLSYARFLWDHGVSSNKLEFTIKLV